MDIKNVNQDNIINILKATLQKAKNNRVTEESALMTYFFILSLGPFLMLVLSVISNYLTQNPRLILNFVEMFLPDAEIYVEPILNYINSTSYQVFGTIGGLSALFLASRMMRVLIRSLNRIFKIGQDTGIKEVVFLYIKALVFTIAVVLGFLIFFVFFVNGNPIEYLFLNFLEIDLSNYALWNFLRTFLPITYLIIFSAFLYRFLPSFRNARVKVKIQDTFIASLLVSLGWTLASVVYSFYLSNINTNNIIYGTLGSFMALMVWINILMVILLLGACLISAIQNERSKNKKSLSI